jgi:hypothetical protein
MLCLPARRPQAILSCVLFTGPTRRYFTGRQRAARCFIGAALLALSSGCGRVASDELGVGGAPSGGASNAGATSGGAATSGGTAGHGNNGGAGQDAGGSAGSSGAAGETLVDGGAGPGGSDGNEAGAPAREPGPCAGDRSVWSQADYEALVAEQCTEISGSLTITQGGELPSQPGLRTLIRVGGTLMVDSNPALKSLLTFASLEAIGGDLTLRGDEQLSSLSGLEHLQSIGGSLQVSDTALSTFAGLDSLTRLPRDLGVTGPVKSLEGLHLTSIGGKLGLTDTLLESLAGLEELTSVGTLQILRAPQLESTEGLSSLVHVDRVDLNGVPAPNLSGFDQIAELPKGLSLDSCAGITSLEAFSHVSRIGQAIEISRNAALESLGGLGHVLETPKLVIDDNPALTSLAGLEGLEQVTTTLDIGGNVALGSLSGLAALNQVGDLSISSNAALTSLHGLEQVKHATSVWIAGNPLLATLAAFMSWPAHALAGDCHIHANPSLPQCQVDAFDPECSTEGGPNLATCN